QGEAIHAADRAQGALQVVHQPQAALRGELGELRVRLGEPGEARDLLVDLRVVLHGAGAERVETEVDGVVETGQTRIVARHLDFAQLREPLDLGAGVARVEIEALGLRHVERRQGKTPPSGSRYLEQELLRGPQAARLHQASLPSSSASRSISARGFVSVTQTSRS